MSLKLIHDQDTTDEASIFAAKRVDISCNPSDESI